VRVVIFAYDFPHRKAVELLPALAELSASLPYPPVVIAAPRQELKTPRREWRVTDRSCHVERIEDACHALAMDYHVAAHDSEDCRRLLANHRITHGAIVGARVLPPYIVDAVPGGILNLHPGLLPAMRGLDTIEWSIIKRVPLGVTAHVIDHRIDMGRLIAREHIEVYADDTPRDAWLRLLGQQAAMFAPALRAMIDGKIGQPIPDGPYHSYAGPSQQHLASWLWDSYRSDYSNLSADGL
jgi:phosphoribosylglycinamide formyltransferase-1